MSRKQKWSGVSKAFAFFIIAVFFVPFPASAETSFLQQVLRIFEGSGAQCFEASGKAEVAFSPRGGGQDLILKAIASAHDSIRVAAYSFTSRPIARALVLAHNTGIDVAAVIDHGQISKKGPTVAGFLAAADIPVRIDYVHAIQHNKYMIIDGKTVQTGSFNFTASAESRNAENVLVLWNSPELAETYMEDWERLWAMAEPYEGR